MYELCGKCMHSKESHIEHNGHFMYCGSCMSLCDKDEFSIKHKPTPLNEQVKLQLAREYTKYIPKEIKKLAKLERTSQEELYKEYDLK